MVDQIESDASPALGSTRPRPSPRQITTVYTLAFQNVNTMGSQVELQFDSDAKLKSLVRDLYKLCLSFDYRS